MPIQNSFRDSEDITKPEYIKEKYHKKYDTIIVTYQRKMLPGLIDNNLIKEVEDIYFGSSMRKNLIYELTDNNKILFFFSPIGSPMAVGMLEEIAYSTGVKNIVMFGTCGTLEKGITSGKVIVPTKSYRDEGTSYHYMPASDFVNISNHNIVSKILDDLNIDFVKGPIWTTDAFYRETKSIFEERKSQGIIAVDMEVSAVQAFANLRGLELYNFLYSADNLDSSEWENRKLGNFKVSERVEFFYLAKYIANSL